MELKARIWVRRCWWAFFGYVVVHCMAIPYLTFWAYSWDIMEPVTYMFNLWGLFLATWFYLRSDLDFSNEGITEALLRIKRNKLYKQYNFDIELYESLRDKIADIEDDLLNPEWSLLKDVHPKIPDILSQIHLKPNELIDKYSLQLIDEIQ